MIERPCLSCGVLLSSGNRHPRCRPQRVQHPIRGTSRWMRYASSLVGAHVRHYGYVCPGDENHAAHPSRDLTVDHIVPLSRGGAEYERANLRILCRVANSGRRVSA